MTLTFPNLKFFREPMMRSKLIVLLLAAPFLVACDPGQDSSDGNETAAPLDIRATEHRDGDDLLTAGLGLDGLAGKAPQPADPQAPTPAELRRMAIHKSWTGIQSFTPAGGLGGLLEELPSVPGREFQAFVTVDGATHPIRVLLQLPDAFDTESPCLVVAPASGSRGVYGAIALAGSPRPCRRSLPALEAFAGDLRWTHAFTTRVAAVQPHHSAMLGGD